MQTDPILDANGNPVLGATAVAVDRGNSTVYTATTNGSGVADFGSVPDGTYDVYAFKQNGQLFTSQMKRYTKSGGGGGTPPENAFDEDFGSLPTGEYPSGFTPQGHATVDVQEVQERSGSISGRVFYIKGSSTKSAREGHSIDALGNNVDDVEIVVIGRNEVGGDEGGNRLYVIMRGSGSGGEDLTGVAVGIRASSDNLRAIIYRNGTSTAEEVDLPSVVQNDEPWVLRARVDGNRIRARAWRYGVDSEPANWQLDLPTGAVNITTGWVGLFQQGTDDKPGVEYERVAVATGGNSVEL